MEREDCRRESGDHISIKMYQIKIKVELPGILHDQRKI